MARQFAITNEQTTFSEEGECISADVTDQLFIRKLIV